MGSKNKNTNFFIYTKKPINVTKANSIQDLFLFIKLFISNSMLRCFLSTCLLTLSKTIDMNDRPNDLLRIRPEIKKTKIFDQMGTEERFQNETLRPILKLQNPLFIAVFRNYIEKHKGVFYDLSLDKRMAYMENALFKDQKFRNALKGMVIGQFTVIEYLEYTKNSSALNKRLMQMIMARLQDQVQLFDSPLSKTA